MEIKRTGKFHIVNNIGEIQNSSIIPIQQSEYKTVLDEIKNEILSHFKNNVHSIYIRGSVAKGIAIPFVSDMDFVVLLKNKAVNIDDFEIITDEKIRTKYHFVNGIEFFFITQDDVSDSKIQFLLKTQCGCIFGNNIIEKIRNFNIGKDAYSHSGDFNKDVQNITEELKTEENEDEIKSICSWIMKRIIRTSFETVMIKDNSYTRDLYLNYEVFCKYHPNKEMEMRKALLLAINPTNNKAEITSTINGLFDYIQNEINKKCI